MPGRASMTCATRSRRVDQPRDILVVNLGHANISDTYWSLTGTPELTELVGARFERFLLQGAGHE